jgi:drug/metabolite transporter (DMT)-like permease
VAGQIFLKKTMSWPAAGRKVRRALIFAAGVGIMALGFFIWVGLMAQFNLSYLFPFEGLHYLFAVIAAAVFLNERASWSLWLGLLLISTGVALVSGS